MYYLGKLGSFLDFLKFLLNTKKLLWFKCGFFFLQNKSIICVDMC